MCFKLSNKYSCTYIIYNIKYNFLTFMCQGHIEGGFQGFQETTLDFIHYLKHQKIETLGFQNLESIKEQNIFYYLC